VRKTIKEKVLDAWTKDLEVTCELADENPLTGFITQWNSTKVYINGKMYFYREITDIRSVGEVEEEEKSVNNKWHVGSKYHDGQLVYLWILDDQYETVMPETGSPLALEILNMGTIEDAQKIVDAHNADLTTHDMASVEAADDGSILGDFQKERTKAVAEMFDNPDPETSIYPTTALYRRG